MKIHNEKFIVKSNNNSVFCIIGDIHNTKRSKVNIWDKIVEEVRTVSPDFIIIPGDLIYDADDLTNSKDKLTHILNELSKIAPLYITYGNHDLKNGKVLKFADTNNYFNEMDRNNRDIHLINNKLYRLDNSNIYLLGINPPYDSYYSEYKNKWATNFITQLLSIDIKNLDESSILIMVIHSPEILVEVRRYIEEQLNLNISANIREELTKAKSILELVNIFVCAHMHNGMLPRILEFGRKNNKSKGIVVCESQKATDEEIGHKVKFRIVDYCRGMHDLYNGKIIISRGVTKWPKSIFNPTGSKDITTVKILKK